MLRLVPLLALLILPACTVTRASANKVVVTDNKAVIEKCAKVADLDGAPTAGSIMLRDPKRDASIANLKAAAAEKGATHVHTTLGDIKWKGPDTTGVAYRCPTA